MARTIQGQTPHNKHEFYAAGDQVTAYQVTMSGVTLKTPRRAPSPWRVTTTYVSQRPDPESTHRDDSGRETVVRHLGQGTVIDVSRSSYGGILIYKVALPE